MPRRAPHKPSLATVADKVGVSTATVSNSFNRPEKVSPEVLARVLAEAERQGYAGPDPAARQLSRGRTDTLGLLFTDELSVRVPGSGRCRLHRGPGHELPERRAEHAADLDGIDRRPDQRRRQRRRRRLRRLFGSRRAIRTCGGSWTASSRPWWSTRRPTCLASTGWGPTTGPAPAPSATC